MTLLAAAVAVGVSLLFGFVAFLILAGMALILVAIIAVRLWWLRRKFRRHMQDQTSQKPADYIEGEYEVEERSDHTRGR
ncbi:MAG TPA: hypothetical protein VFK45_04635 [Gammaproteobacteria bacterium]|nr:hypothetical protein [Gammaproteobacteria bacterium]